MYICIYIICLVIQRSFRRLLVITIQMKSYLLRRPADCGDFIKSFCFFPWWINPRITLQKAGWNFKYTLIYKWETTGITSITRLSQLQKIFQQWLRLTMWYSYGNDVEFEGISLLFFIFLLPSVCFRGSLSVLYCPGMFILAVVTAWVTVSTELPSCIEILIGLFPLVESWVVIGPLASVESGLWIGGDDDMMCLNEYSQILQS